LIVVVADTSGLLAWDATHPVNVVLAAEFQTNAILTLDHRGYRVVTPLSTHDAFLLLPDDADTASL
jgi:hypothetical protein